LDSISAFRLSRTLIRTSLPALNFEFITSSCASSGLLILQSSGHNARGFGTMDELFELLTLIQTKKIKKKMPIVIYDKLFWDKVINLEELANKRLIDKDDLKLFFVAETIEEAYEYIICDLQKHYMQQPISLFNQKVTITPKEKRKLKFKRN
jgi:hypothetical protein